MASFFHIPEIRCQPAMPFYLDHFSPLLSLPPVPLLPARTLQRPLIKHVSGRITSLCTNKTRLRCLQDASMCLHVRTRHTLHQKSAWSWDSHLLT